MRRAYYDPDFEWVNLEYVTTYDYDRTNCHCHDDICRCTEIINTSIVDIHLSGVLRELMKKYCKSASIVDVYCFERLCYVFKIYDKSLYEVEVGSGYYGEEIYGVYFDKEKELAKAYQDLCELKTNLDKIQHCLYMEYGYLIPSVGCATNVSIVEVSPEKVVVPQMEYFKRVDKDVIAEYKNRYLPIAVCVKDGEWYKLVDGYHRFVANKDSENIDIVVLES